MLTEQVIDGYLALARRWGWRRRGRGSLATGWYLICSGPLRDYDVFLDVDDSWVYLQCPLLEIAPLKECETALYAYLLRLNARMFLGKLILTGQDDGGAHQRIALSVELPVSLLDAGTFQTMTECLLTYATSYDQEIQAVALDPAIAALVHLESAEDGVDDGAVAASVHTVERPSPTNGTSTRPLR
jgi:hypothetical protein